MWDQLSLTSCVSLSICKMGLWLPIVWTGELRPRGLSGVCTVTQLVNSRAGTQTDRSQAGALSFVLTVAAFPWTSADAHCPF